MINGKQKIEVEVSMLWCDSSDVRKGDMRNCRRAVQDEVETVWLVYHLWFYKITQLEGIFMS